MPCVTPWQIYVKWGVSPCITPAQADDTVKVVILGKPLCSEVISKVPGTCSDNNIIIGDPVAHQCCNSAPEQRMRDLTVPVGHDNAEPHP
ncbi:MAG: hypothetical protein MZV63_11705 [Marinilabiliales bacterium]|nr:hypothetical protein [Marinilabiliales bacterium]